MLPEAQSMRQALVSALNSNKGKFQKAYEKKIKLHKDSGVYSVGLAVELVDGSTAVVTHYGPTTTEVELISGQIKALPTSQIKGLASISDFLRAQRSA